MQANGHTLSSPCNTFQNIDVLSGDSISTQEGGMRSDDSLKLHESMGWRSVPQINWPVASGTAYDRNVDMPKSKESSQASVYAIDRLQQFELRIRDVAEQAAALRSESHLLRNNALVDPQRVDALLSLLRLSIHGADDGGGSATCAGAQQRANGMQTIAQQPKPSTAWHTRIPGLPLQSSIVSDAHAAHVYGPQARPANLPNDLHQQCDDQRLVKPLRRRNHRHDQLSTLRQWFDEHVSDPYPTPEEKQDLADQLGMEVKQIEHCESDRLHRHAPAAYVHARASGAHALSVDLCAAGESDPHDSS